MDVVMETFEVNGKKYKARKLDFLFLVYLEKCGGSISEITNMTATNAFFSYCSGMNHEQTAEEITKHVINNNGEFPQSLMEVYGKMIEESDFFRAIMEREEQGEQEMESTGTEETTKKKTSRKASE
jgi:hypothetical protein